MRIAFAPGSVRECFVPFAEVLHCLNKQERGGSCAGVVPREAGRVCCCLAVLARAKLDCEASRRAFVLPASRFVGLTSFGNGLLKNGSRMLRVRILALSNATALDAPCQDAEAAAT